MYTVTALCKEYRVSHLFTTELFLYFLNNYNITSIVMAENVYYIDGID